MLDDTLVVSTSYCVVVADNSELNNVQWRVVIIDEAHRLKNKNCKLLEGLKMLNMVGVCYVLYI